MAWPLPESPTWYPPEDTQASPPQLRPVGPLCGLCEVTVRRSPGWRYPAGSRRSGSRRCRGTDHRPLPKATPQSCSAPDRGTDDEGRGEGADPRRKGDPGPPERDDPGLPVLGGRVLTQPGPVPHRQPQEPGQNHVEEVGPCQEIHRRRVGACGDREGEAGDLDDLAHTDHDQKEQADPAAQDQPGPVAGADAFLAPAEHHGTEQEASCEQPRGPYGRGRRTVR